MLENVSLRSTSLWGQLILCMHFIFFIFDQLFTNDVKIILNGVVWYIRGFTKT